VTRRVFGGLVSVLLSAQASGSECVARVASGCREKGCAIRRTERSDRQRR
jgi:hypothetical protein